MPRKKKHRLNSRQQRLIKELAKGQTHEKAAIAAGYTKKHPRQAASQALEQIRNTLPEMLEKCGLDDKTIIDKYLHPLIKAKETKFFPLPVGRGKNRTLQIHTREVVNLAGRANGLDLWGKIRGAYVREAENKGPQFSVIIINAENRPDWDAMRAKHPAIEVPGLAPPAHPELDEPENPKTNGNGSNGKH